jgi:hypothetical protein
MTVPIASVHWVLAANRQIELGNKIGVGNLKSFEHRVLLDKLGLGQGMYNRLYLLKGKAGKIGAAILTGR